MLLKEFTALLIIAISILQTNATDNNGKVFETSDLLKNEDFIKPKKNINKEEEWKKHKSFNPEGKDKFEKDKKNWNDHQHHNSHVYKKHLDKLNEIDSNEFVEKYNKYGKKFNPDLLDKNIKKQKKFYDQENFNKNRVKSLAYDTDVNFLKKNLEIEQNSELISQKFSEPQKTKENYQENYQNKNELFMKRSKKNFYDNIKNIDLSKPPTNDTTLLARYIVHTVDWTALATLSSKNSTKGGPFVCVKAFSDGPVDKSSGVPFFYLSTLDVCAKDIEKNNRVAILATLSQTDYCKNEDLDSQDPRCAKVTLSGEIKRVKLGTDEARFAKDSLFSRHPMMAAWPQDHSWYFAKLKISEVALIHTFGGVTYINVKEYLNGGPLNTVK